MIMLDINGWKCLFITYCELFILISYLWTFWVLRRLSDISLASEERYDSWQGRVLIIKPGMNFLNNSNWSLALSVKMKMYTKLDDQMVHTLKTTRLYYVNHNSYCLLMEDMWNVRESDKFYTSHYFVQIASDSKKIEILTFIKCIQGFYNTGTNSRIYLKGLTFQLFQMI